MNGNSDNRTQEFVARVDGKLAANFRFRSHPAAKLDGRRGRAAGNRRLALGTV